MQSFSLRCVSLMPLYPALRQIRALLIHYIFLCGMDLLQEETHVLSVIEGLLLTHPISFQIEGTNGGSGVQTVSPVASA